MPNVVPADLIRRIQALEVRAGIADNPEPTSLPYYRGEPLDAQLLLFQGPPAPLATTPGKWRPVSMSGDATIDDEGVITVTGAGSLALDYLAALDDSTGTAIATNTFHIFTFNVSGGDTLGTDIEIQPSGAHTGWPVINTDGVYAVNAWLRSQADTAADTFDWAQFVFSILRAGSGRYGPVLVQGFAPALILASNKHYAETSFSWTGIMNAGDEFEAQALMGGGGAGTWSVTGGFVQVDRIA